MKHLSNSDSLALLQLIQLLLTTPTRWREIRTNDTQTRYFNWFNYSWQHPQGGARFEQTTLRPNRWRFHTNRGLVCHQSRDFHVNNTSLESRLHLARPFLLDTSSDASLQMSHHYREESRIEEWGVISEDTQVHPIGILATRTFFL